MTQFNNSEQLRQIKKVFLAPFLFLISIILIFISYNLIKSEYNEYFVFGSIHNGTISNVFWENSSSESPPTKQFNCEINVGESKFNYVIQNAEQPYIITNLEKIFIENVSIKDSVIVKILNKKHVKVLEWKKLSLNKKNNFWNIFFIWFLILTLIIIPIFLLKLIYKIYKQ